MIFARFRSRPDYGEVTHGIDCSKNEYLVMAGLEVISAFKGAGMGSLILGAIYAIISLLLLTKPAAPWSSESFFSCGAEPLLIWHYVREPESERS